MYSLICASLGGVLSTVLYVVIAIVVLLTMVLIHELGHYIAGRILGFKIVEFSIGFGKVLWQRKNKRGELISLRLIPLGGFCAFYGEDEGSESANDKNLEKIELNNNQVEDVSKKTEVINISKNKPIKFNDMKAWKRIIVFFAGVTLNFLSAFIFSIIFLCVGGYDGYVLNPAKGYDVKYTYTTEYGLVEGSLEKDTLVYAINGTKINYAKENVFSTLVNPNDTQIILTIQLDNKMQDVVINKQYKDAENNDIFAITYKTVNIDYGFGDVMADFIPFTFRISVLIVEAFGQIITGQVALNQLGGPISTITQMTEIASVGLANFLYLLPLLAANLAIFNILPIPGLDGAHVVFTTIEWIRRKPIKREVENAIHAWGIILLFAFVIIIDIVHMLTV